MISGGGKYWAVAGSGAAKATSASAAAHRTAFAFMDAILVCDLLAAWRDLRRASPRRKSHLAPPQPIGLFASPVAHLIAAFELRSQPDDFCASP
jgi:hypothetical protein